MSVLSFKKVGQEGGSPGENWEAGIGSPKVVEPGEISQHFDIFRNRDGTKRREPLWKGAGSGSKRYRKLKVQTPPPPMSPFSTSKVNVLSVLCNIKLSM